MAYQLSNQEIVEHHFHIGLSRVLLEQVQKAELLFKAYLPNNHRETIEQVRECVFRIHAVLELLQPFTGEKLLREEKGFRKLKVALSQQNEDSEVVRALTKLKYLSPEANSVTLLERLKKRYLDERDSQPEITQQRRRFVEKAHALLIKAQKSFQVSLPEIYDIDMFSDVVINSHQEVVRSYNNCLQFGGDDDFHQLHSAINVLYYQTEVLQNFAFAPTHIKRKYLERLSSKLDLYNDLTTLACRLQKWRGTYLSNENFAMFAQITETQKSILTANLLQLGKNILKINFTAMNENAFAH